MTTNKKKFIIDRDLLELTEEEKKKYEQIAKNTIEKRRMKNRVSR